MWRKPYPFRRSGLIGNHHIRTLLMEYSIDFDSLVSLENKLPQNDTAGKTLRIPRSAYIIKKPCRLRNWAGNFSRKTLATNIFWLTLYYQQWSDSPCPGSPNEETGKHSALGRGPTRRWLYGLDNFLKNSACCHTMQLAKAGLLDDISGERLAEQRYGEKQTRIWFGCHEGI